MFKSLVYKEWLKIKWIFVGLLSINFLVILNIYFDVSNTFKIYSANLIIGKYLMYEIVFYSNVMYIALISGIVLGVFQFFPEINQTRLKLTFHLPVKENKLIVQMVGFGAGLLLAIFLLDLILLSITVLTFFPKEFFYSMWITSMPWFLGGICVYFWVVVIFVEPNWSKRIILLLVTFGVIGLYFSDLLGGSGYNKYSPSLIWFLLLTILSGTVIFISAYNFKRGIC